MPNYCYNKLTISGQKESIARFMDMAKAKDSTGELISLASLIPLSDDSDEESSKSILDKAIEQWGTKWDVCDCSIMYEDNSKTIIEFFSAWTPPEKAIKEIATKFHDLMFVLNYEEAGVGFAGSLEVKGEDVLVEEYRDY